MIRAAAGLILLSQVLLVWMGLAPSGTSAIWFSFVGTPCLVVGAWLGWRGLRREVRGDVPGEVGGEQQR